MKNKQQVCSRIRILAVSGLLAAGLLLLGGCSWLDSLTASLTTVLDDHILTLDTNFTDPAEDVAGNNSIDSAAQTAETNGSGQLANASAPADPAGRFVLTADLDNLITEQIILGLDQTQKEIDLSPLLADYKIPENQVENLIQRIYDLFRQIYYGQPLYFFLDGSIHVQYELQSGWGDRVLTSLNLTIGYLDPNKQAADLAVLRQALLTEAARIAALADTGRPAWEKILVVHDELIRSIVYDSTLDPANNNAASALLNHTAMCQGYAQAFQLICQILDLDVSIITGQAAGIDHAWNLVTLDGVTYHLDVTHDDPVPDGGANEPVSHQHFLRSDAVMQATHTWDSGQFTACPVDGALYFIQNGLIADTRQALDTKIAQFMSSMNFQDAQSDQLEILYTGPDIPLEADIKPELTALMQQVDTTRTLYYRFSISKQIIQLIIAAP